MLSKLFLPTFIFLLAALNQHALAQNFMVQPTIGTWSVGEVGKRTTWQVPGRSYTLSNNTTTSVPFTASENIVGMTLSGSSGTVPAGSGVTISVRPDDEANDIRVGESKTGTLIIKFGNQTFTRELKLSATPAVPPNDDFQNAETLVLETSGAFAATGSNVGSTSETNEPSHGFFDTINSVWWRFGAPTKGKLVISGEGSSFHRLLKIYTGNGLANLTSKGLADSTSGRESLTIDVEAGEIYHVVVDGFSVQRGYINLSGSFTPDASASTTTIVAALLPTARTTTVNNTVTAFATIINAGTERAISCSPGLPTGTAADFSYQRTNAANTPVGTPDTPTNINVGQAQSFVFALTPRTAVSRSLDMVFDCLNSEPAATVPGLNTFLYTSGNTSLPDMVSIAATPGNTGYAKIPSEFGVTAFGVSAINLGSAGRVVARVTSRPIGGGPSNLSATFAICQTNSSGTCLATPGPTAAFDAVVNGIYTFSVFVTGTGNVSNNPDTNRAHVYFDFGTNRTAGATSVAVCTAC